jgi:DNA-binding protein HU-beta
MGTKWDQEGCYLEVSPRTARAAKRAAAKGATTAAKGATTTAKGATATAKATAAKAAKGGGEPTTTLKPMTNDEAYAAAENNVYGNTFLNWGANERASVKKLRALRAQSKKTKHKGGNRTHKRKNQKRRSTRRLKRHHKI